MSVVAYKNLFTTTGVTVTASTEAVGFEKENAYDYKQYDWWQPTGVFTDDWIKAAFSTAKTANYVAIWGHNLFTTSFSYKVQWSDDDIAWSDAFSFVDPVDNKTIYKEFDSGTHKYWRVYFEQPAFVVLIAGIQLGETTTLETGLQAGLAIPSISPMIENKTAMSELGVNLGATIKRTGVKGSIQLNNMTPAWARSDLEPLIDHLNKGYPAVFAWDSVNYPSETLLIWKTDDIPAPTYTSPLWMSANIPFEGVE